MEIKNLKIAIVGGGNLGRSVADGFLKAGIAASKLTVSRRRVQLLDDLGDRLRRGQGGDDDPGHSRVPGYVRRDAFDVESPGAEGSGDPGQDVGPVVDGHRYHPFF